MIWVNSFRYTEVHVEGQVSAQDRTLPLHSQGLSISKVSVEGIPAQFQLLPRAHGCDVRSLTGGQEAAELAERLHEESVATDLLPELIITLPHPPPPVPYGSPPLANSAEVPFGALVEHGAKSGYLKGGSGRCG